MSTKTTYAQNTVHRVKDGLLEVTEYHDSTRIDVRFIESGFRTTARAQHIANGEVKDHTLPTKKELIKQRAEKNRTRPRFLVTTSEGKELLFNNTAQIAEMYNVSRATIYNIMRGDFGTRINIQVQALG